jgi:predicted HicB family RNase H-like nuclease
MNEILHLRISASDKERLENQAKAYSLSLAAYVRLKLNDYQFQKEI